MNIAILAPSPVPFVLGGAENLWSSLLDYLNTHTEHQADLIKLPTPERDFWQIIDSYRAFSAVNLDHFDAVIVTKYPAWMIQHRHKIVYLQHKLRGLYDTYPEHLPTDLALSLFPVGERWGEGLVNLLKTENPNRDHLALLWQHLDDLRCRQDSLPAELFALPNPLIRAIVHFMDKIAPAPSEVARYATLSHTVANRSEHFPEGVSVHVLPHPSGLQAIAPSAYNTIFTTSRHDAPKRLELLIKAYKQTKVTNPLRIAGEGPQTETLKVLAAGDNRIRFLGRISPEQLQQEYAQALFVPFVPYQEDLGLITLEAMNSCKAVLTTTDSGGASEIVQQQQTGLIVNPDEDSLAAAIIYLCTDTETAIRMGQAGQASIAHIRWKTLVETLLPPPAKRPHLLVLNTYSIYPSMGGGQQRIYQLYRHLAQWADITLLALVPSLGDVGRIQIAPNFIEERIARSLYHHTLERQLADELNASVGDLSAILYYQHNPLFLQRVKELVAGSDLVILSHPYCYPALRSVYSGDYVYEAHNVEADLKHSILGHSPAHLQTIIDCERDCAQQTRQTIACSQADADRLVECYQLDVNAVSVVANGSDTQGVQPASRTQQAQARIVLGLDKHQTIALLMASYHGPNNQALEHILALAPLCPKVTFVVLGSVAQHAYLNNIAVANNVRLTGAVSDETKQHYLAASDIALNPMTTGSGTNLKMLDYAAAGLLIVSTAFGGRGGLLTADHHFIACEIDAMPQLLNQLAATTTQPYQQMIEQARAIVVQQADWQILAAAYQQHLQRVTSKNHNGKGGLGEGMH